MKPTIAKVKNAKNRIVAYTATLWNISAAYPTKHGAVTACEVAVGAALKRLAEGTIIKQWRGHLMVLWPDCDGWRYWVDTFGRHDYSVASETRTSVESDALSHLAQNLWTKDVDDVEFLRSIHDRNVRDNMKGWIAFQRCHQKLRDEQDADDPTNVLIHEHHRTACEQAPAYAREHFGGL